MNEREAAVEEAARYLRLALPLMSRHQCPVTPINYAVWFEYVSGRHQALMEALDQHIASSGGVDDETLADLNQRFLMPATDARLKGSRDGMVRLIEEVSGLVTKAGGDASRYQASLADYSERLTPDVGHEELAQLVEGLATETRAACEASADMRRRLDESRKEVESLRAELEEVRVEASCDVLTGLVNRKGFEAAFAAAVEPDAEPGSSQCLLIGDIDHFKQVNDTHGHVVGDKVIKHVAGIIRASVKGKDTACRYGGEEFAILLPDTPLDGAAKLAENVRAEVERSRLVKSASRESIGTITLSLGAARYRDGESLEDFVGRADEALYRAKVAGRNRVELELAEDTLATGTGG